MEEREPGLTVPMPVPAGGHRATDRPRSRFSVVPAEMPGFLIPVLLGLLLLVCYLPTLLLTARFVLISDDMAYGLFAPMVALYVAWERREDLLRPRFNGSYWSIVFFVFGAMLGIFSSLAQSSTFSRLGFLFSLTGSLLLLGGWQLLRRFVFPLLILLFTFPVPEVLYAQVTQPLQGLATGLAQNVFEMFNYSVLREGNLLQLGHMTLSVEEACSGLRSLITLFFFCLVYAYFFESVLWVRLILVLLAIPSAIAVNALRITGTGILGEYQMAWTTGTYHVVLGWTAFLIGFMLVLLAHRCIARGLTGRLAGSAQ